MKTLQKATLAVAIAAVPFMATNALEALDDDVLSNMTGQAGVTIETTTGASGTTIGHIYYTDTDGLAEHATDDVGGSVAITAGSGANAISVTGGTYDAATETWTAGSTSTTQTIDVDSQGSLVISRTAATNMKRTAIGQVELRSKAQHAAGDTGAILVANLELIQQEGAGETRIINLSDLANNSTVTDTAGVYTYSDISGTAVQNVNITGAVDTNSNLAIVSKGSSRIVNMNVDALDGAIEIRGLSYDNGSGGMMESTSVIWAVGGTASPTNDAGVWIQGSDSVGTLAIKSIGIGGSSIGSVSIGDINQSGSLTRIYGH